MDSDQLAILYVYDLYTNEKEHRYLQYTAALAIFYYLMKKGLFPDYKEELLVYDYKDSRRFLWEDKKFMSDINIVRGYDYLIRSRVKTSEYRDINAHLCTEKGSIFMKADPFLKTEKAIAIRKALSDSKNKLFELRLDDDLPRLVSNSGKQSIDIEGFLCDMSQEINESFSPVFL